MIVAACLVAALVLVWAAFGFEGDAAPVFAVLAVLLVSIGAVVERWLFFAQAKHVVSLFYGEQSV